MKIITNQKTWSLLSCDPELKWSIIIIEVFTRKTGKNFAKVKLKEENNNRCHHSSTVTGTKQSLTRLFNSHRHNCSTVTNIIIQQLLAPLFNSHWQDYSTVTGTIVQQSLARLINSGWNDSSTVTDIILQQSLAGLFNSGWHDS